MFKHLFQSNILFRNIKKSSNYVAGRRLRSSRVMVVTFTLALTILSCFAPKIRWCAGDAAVRKERNERQSGRKDYNACSHHGEYGWSRRITPHILNRGIEGGWSPSRPRPLYPRANNPGTNGAGGWVTGRASLDV